MDPHGACNLTSQPLPIHPTPAMQGMLQTFADLRNMLASVRRVRATLSELPPDESQVGPPGPPPGAPRVAPTARQGRAAGAGAPPTPPPSPPG